MKSEESGGHEQAFPWIKISPVVENRQERDGLLLLFHRASAARLQRFVRKDIVPDLCEGENEHSVEEE